MRVCPIALYAKFSDSMQTRPITTTTMPVEEHDLTLSQQSERSTTSIRTEEVDAEVARLETLPHENIRLTFSKGQAQGQGKPGRRVGT